MRTTDASVAAMVGETLTDIQGLTVGSESVTFTTASGRTFRMYHEDDCCESVNLNEIIGDAADIIGAPLLMAEEATNEADPGRPDEYSESWTWTFYKFGTIKGYVTLRWLGESNGYYSESVTFVEDK